MLEILFKDQPKKCGREVVISKLNLISKIQK